MKPDPIWRRWYVVIPVIFAIELLFASWVIDRKHADCWDRGGVEMYRYVCIDADRRVVE